MASYASTSSLLRHSVFDAAFEIGLADPKLAAWLEEEEPPSSPDSKPPPPQQQQQPRAPTSFKPPPISTRTPSADRWAAVSPQSDSSASLSTVPSASSQATSLSSHDPNAGFAQRARPSKTISPPPNSNDVFPQSHTVPPATFAVDIATAAPSIKPTKQSMKLLKKNRGGASKKPEVARGDSADVGTEERGRFAFLQREPSPPPSTQQDKDASKSFFGRLRDRSRSKSKVRKNTIDSGSNSNSPQKTVEPTLPSNEDRGRSQDPKHVVTVVTSGGAPQLQLDAPSNRKSSDLLATFGDQFGTPLSFDTTLTTTTAAPAPSRPIPRPGQRPIMDRSYARARTSGLWANKERGFTVSRGNGGGSRTGVTRKGSTTGKPSLRSGAAGPRRVPSTRRRTGVRSRSTSVGSEAAFKQVVEEEEVAEIPDEEGFDSEGGPTHATSSSSGHGHRDAYERPRIPKIVQHRPSNGSALSSLTLLQPIPPSPSPSPNGSVQTFLPRTPSPNRLSGTPTGIRRHSRNIPSPLQPPTTPLPPTPTELAPPRSRGGDSSHWYDDDEEAGRFGSSRPVSPAGSYVVPTPTPGATTFHAEAARTAPVPVAAKYAPQRGSNERTLPPMKPLPPGVTGAVVRPRTPSDATRSGMTPAPSIENLKGAVAAPSAWPTTLRPTHSRRSAMSSHTSEDRTSPRPSLETDARPSLDIVDPTANHTRSDSASSNGQRGRMSPFPTHPISRSNSRATTPIPAGYDDYVPRLSEDSVRMGSDESVPGLSLRRKGSIAGPIKPGDREKLPAGRPYAALGVRAPSPSPPPMPKLAAYQNRAASPAVTAAPPPTSMRNQAPLNVRPSSLQNRAASPGLRPTSTVNRQGTFPPRNSVYSKSAKLRENIARPDIKSVYSTGEWESEDDGDRFGFGFDDEDEEEGNGFDVIAKMIGSGPIAAAAAQSRPAPGQLNIPSSSGGRGRGGGGKGGENVLTVPILPLSPQPSPRMRMRTPVGAGGAKWI